MATLRALFDRAVVQSKQLPERPDNATLLAIYSLYKQATEGDVTGSRPGMLDPKGRAKFDAWTARKGTSAADARKAYVALVAELVQKLG